MDATAMIRPQILNLNTYKPVVPFATLAEKLGRPPEEIIKLDANENPYGPPEGVLAALGALGQVNRYPDPDSLALREALAQETNVPLKNLLVGAGSDELLSLLSRLFLNNGDTLLDCPPTFGMYAFFAAVMGANVARVPRQPDFSLDLDAIEACIAREHPKLLCLAAPNNPDGSWLPDADLARLLALPLIIVLDEAYIEFAAGESRIGKVREHDNLIVLRTFSKWAGLAGLRVGYGAFPDGLLPHILKIKEPYTVSAPAHAGALAILKNKDYLSMHRQRIIEQREALISQLESIDYLTSYPSQANFVLCRVDGRNANEVKLALENEGILVRYFFGKPGMDNFLRISVGRPEQMVRLVNALKTI